MTQPIYRYELDPTGGSPNNYVLNEPVTLTSNALRVFVPQQGAYYDGTMMLVDTATGLTLTADQYYPSQAAIIPSAKYGKGIYYCAVVNDPTVSPNISASYQALGGEWAYSNSALATQIESLLTDTRNVQWELVTGKPLFFKPEPHLQSSSDLYGMEYVVEAIYAVRDAITIDNYALLASIVDRLRIAETNNSTSISAVRTEFTSAINALTTLVGLGITGSGGIDPTESITRANADAALTLAIETETAARTLNIATLANAMASAIACRATVNFNGVTLGIRSSNNVGSVTRTPGQAAHGSYRIVWSTPMPTASYAVHGNGSFDIAAMDAQHVDIVMSTTAQDSQFVTLSVFC